VNPKAVVVVHREPMVAEGIAVALGIHPGIVPIATSSTVQGLDRYADHADAVALDRDVQGAQAAARRLRRNGVRVVFIGRNGRREPGVSTDAPISKLAGALVPGAGGGRDAGGRLTLREREVLSLVARGFAAKQVARQLDISPKTVERHKTRIFAKLGVPNQAAAVSEAMGKELERSTPWMQLTS
jgi:DNA-binding CsgD family transcriptional regulator